MYHNIPHEYAETARRRKRATFPRALLHMKDKEFFGTSIHARRMHNAEIFSRRRLRAAAPLAKEGNCTSGKDTAFHRSKALRLRLQQTPHTTAEIPAREIPAAHYSRCSIANFVRPLLCRRQPNIR